MAEEESSTAFVKQILENNASETKMAIDITLDCIKKLVKKSDKTPLNLTTTIEAEGMELKMDKVTLGMVATELKDNNWFTKVNSRSGAIPSNLYLQAQISRVLPMVQPGTPVYNKFMSKMMQLNDQDITMADIEGQQAIAPQQQAGGNPEEMPDAISDTERAVINPRASEQQPIF
jgi:hypothetical protein